MDLTENSLKNGRCVWNTDFDFITFINKWTNASQGFRKCEYRLSVRPDDSRLVQFSQGIETIIVKRLEKDKIIIEKNMQDMFESFKKDIVDEQKEFVKKKNLSSQSTTNDEKIIDLLSTIRTDQRLQRQEMVSLSEEINDFHAIYNEIFLQSKLSNDS